MSSACVHWLNTDRGDRRCPIMLGAHSVISMWHVVCLQHPARTHNGQSVLPIDYVILLPQCLSGFLNYDYCIILLIVWYISRTVDNVRILLGFVVVMMTSSNVNIFRVTGRLCGEFSGNRWIPITKASGAELWCFLWFAPWIKGWIDNRDAGDLRRHSAHYVIF